MGLHFQKRDIKRLKFVWTGRNPQKLYNPAKNGTYDYSILGITFLICMYDKK